MFEAQYLVTDDPRTGGSVDGPWFRRSADRIRYTLDLVDVTSATLEVALFHKNEEDPGNGSATGSAIAFTDTKGRSDAEFTSGLEELVRYRFTARVETDGDTGYVPFRMLSPVWFDAVKG